jgi:hypothetical protein
MNKLVFSLVVSGMATYSIAQQNTVSTGGVATGTGGSASYSIGQVDYINSSGSNGNINQGVQQPFEFFKDASLTELNIVDATLFPNPTNQFLIVQLDKILNELNYRIFDVNGKVVRIGNIKELESTIDVLDLATGNYQFNLYQQGTLIQSIKIIKH